MPQTSESTPEKVWAALDRLTENLDRISRERAADNREWNKQRGELANKLGRLIEDMVAPSVPRVVQEVFGVPADQIEYASPRVRARRGSESREFDVVTFFPGHALITEAKTELRPEDIRRFVRRLPDARRFVPGIGDRRIVGAVASLYLHPTLIRHAERQGLVVMGLGDELMEPKNAPGFVPRVF